MKRWIKRLAIIAVALALFIQTPTFQWVKSLAVMSVYSTYEVSYSVLADKGIKIKIPGGASTMKKDWYPFVITFQDDKGFSWYIGKEARMTVLYNFGHFSPWIGRSLYYDTDSPYYNSFYGAYAVSLEDGGTFGFVDGEPSVEEMAQVPTYDMKYLVMQSLGCKDPVFDHEVVEQGYRTILDDEEWFYFDAKMYVSGSIHPYTRDHRSYIQYGRPPVDIGEQEAYEPVDMYGRIYAKYNEAKDVTLFFYCIAADMEVVDEWEEAFMAKTELKFK